MSYVEAQPLDTSGVARLEYEQKEDDRFNRVSIHPTLPSQSRFVTIVFHGEGRTINLSDPGEWGDQGSGNETGRTAWALEGVRKRPWLVGLYPIDKGSISV